MTVFLKLTMASRCAENDCSNDGALTVGTAEVHAHRRLLHSGDVFRISGNFSPASFYKPPS